MKILFLTPHPEGGSSSRVRVYQFQQYLEAKGHVCRVRPFLSPEAFRRRQLRLSSNLEHAVRVTAGFFRRIRDLVDAAQNDVIFIHREALPYGPPVFEKLLSLFNCKMVVDFDDALFLPEPQERSGSFYRWMKNPSRLGATLRLAVHAIAGNSYLADYARRHCEEVTVLPSVIDCHRYVPAERHATNQPLVIGWMGSPSTVRHLLLIKNALFQLSKRCGIQIKVVGASIPTTWGITALCKDFELVNEIRDLQSFDIGIMPLADEEWSRGKCAFKALQYMGVGIPVVSSRVGAVQDIINDGENGMLAGTEDDWLTKLEILIANPELRYAIGLRARQYVTKHYSVDAALPRLLLVLERSASGNRARDSRETITESRPQA
jgi:glycosyltransferase involved in cell wall biosynthesis